MHLGMIVLPVVVFLPVFIVALVMLRAVGRAFVLATTICAGLFGGTLVGLLCTKLLLSASRPNLPHENGTVVVLLALACTIAGTFIALYALNKFSKYPPWRRY